MYFHVSSPLHFLLSPFPHLSEKLGLGRVSDLKRTIRVVEIHGSFLPFKQPTTDELLNVLVTQHLAARGPSVHKIGNKDFFSSSSLSCLLYYCDSSVWKESILSALVLAQNFSKNQIWIFSCKNAAFFLIDLNNSYYFPSLYFQRWYKY